MLPIAVISLALFATFHVTHAMLEEHPGEGKSLVIHVEPAVPTQRILVLNTIHGKESWLPAAQEGVVMQNYKIDQNVYRAANNTPAPPEQVQEFDRAIILYGGSDFENKGPLWFAQEAFKITNKCEPDVVCFAGVLPGEQASEFLQTIHNNVSIDVGTQFLFLRQNRGTSGLHSVAQTLEKEGYQVHEVALYEDERIQGDGNLWRLESAIETMVHRAFAKAKKGVIPYNKDAARTVDPFVDFIWASDTYMTGLRCFLFMAMMGAEGMVIFGFVMNEDFPKWASTMWGITMLARVLAPMVLEGCRSLYLRTQY